MHASRMAVRAQASRFWRGLAMVLIAAMTALVSWWALNASQRSIGPNREGADRQQTESTVSAQKLNADNEELKASMQAFERQAGIDRAAQAELTKNLNQLQEENAHLKEEVSFLRGIMSSGKAPEGLSVQNFRIEPDTLPNEYRFQVLLIQGGAREKDFVGKAQLMVSLLKDGVTTVLTLPDDQKMATGFDVNLKYYQRLQGIFKVEPGTVLKSAQLRVTDKTTGQVRLTRSLTLT